jgi:peptide/nickel transport system substrate-binding protein
MMKRRSVLAGAAAAAAVGLARPALAQGAKVLKYVPQANLANPDPIWTTATVARLHGYMVWDTLYGIDDKLSASRRCWKAPIRPPTASPGR